MTTLLFVILLTVASSGDAATSRGIALVAAGTLSIFINCRALADMIGLLCVTFAPLLLMELCDGVPPPLGVTSASLDSGWPVLLPPPLLTPPRPLAL